MSSLETIYEDILEQSIQTAIQGLETNTRLINFKLKYLELIKIKLNEIKPFDNYHRYIWIINKNIKWLKRELSENKPGVDRLISRFNNNKDDEQYLMNTNLRIIERIQQWNKSYLEYVDKYDDIETGRISVLDTFENK